MSRGGIDPELGLPPGRPSSALLPIGWLLGRYARPERKPVDEVLYWNRFQEI